MILWSSYCKPLNYVSQKLEVHNETRIPIHIHGAPYNDSIKKKITKLFTAIGGRDYNYYFSNNELHSNALIKALRVTTLRDNRKSIRNESESFQGKFNEQIPNDAVI